MLDFTQISQWFSTMLEWFLKIVLRSKVELTRIFVCAEEIFFWVLLCFVAF